ncbi:MAG: PrsW family intramembrane metalloprotease [Bacteroidales bacterium]|nr:PrsW family intramembrane metalloprotease [Bacteroidales bacterium]
MNSQIILILSASLIGLIYLLIIRNYDIYEKEPFFKLLLVSVFGGIISVIASLFLYQFVDVQHTFADAILKIGPIEEFSKLLALIILHKFIKKEFDEIVDGLVYIAAIALGFSIIENIFYATAADNPPAVLVQRSIYSVLGHISFSGYLGLAYFIHVRVRKNIFGIILAVILASLAHGLYDGVIFYEPLNAFFQATFIGILILQFILIKVVLGFSSFRKDLSADLFMESERIVAIRCAMCGSSIREKEIRFWHIHGARCKSCDSLVFHGKNVNSLFNYFRPALRISKYMKSLSKNKQIKFLDEQQKIAYNWQRSTLSASITDLADWLTESNRKDRRRILRIPVLGVLILLLGIRFLREE